MRSLQQSLPFYWHYVPGEVALYLDHDPGLQPDAIHTALQGHPVAARDHHLRAALQRPPRIVTIPHPTQPASMAFFEVDTIDREDHPTWAHWLSDLAARLDRASAAHGGVTPRMATLNWLASGTSNPGGLGGPAAWPIPDDAAATREAAGMSQPAWEFSLPVKLGSEQRGEGIEVAVLDTAPDLADLERAAVTWPNHPLLRTLLGPKGRLRTWYAGYTHLLQLVDYGLPGHPYVMSDHGLFSAGIIHSIAPKAAIELVEVLNPYGAGDLETITAGLAHLAARTSSAPLVVNCSWVLALSRPSQQAAAAQVHPIYYFLDPDTLRRLSLPIQWICDRLAQQQILLVAAAGNDRSDGRLPPPPPRYPAAFDSVIGVGGLDLADKPAAYSNQSDEPLAQGIATLGGGIKHTAAGWLTDPQTGILGIYTSAFPTGGRSMNGWARWAGTSFAAPIVSGVLAALLSENGGDPRAAVAAMHDATADQTPIGGAFVVRQGHA